MKIKTAVKIGAASLLTIIGSCSTIYRIDETQQAVVFQFGQPKKIILGSNEAGQIDTGLVRKVTEWNNAQVEEKRADVVTAGAGIWFKIPIFQSVEKFDDRLLDYSSAATDVVTLDKKHLLIDTYAKWRIVNPLLFRQTAVTENGAQSRLDDNIYSIVREYVGKHNLNELVRSTNTKIINSEGSYVDSIGVGKEIIMKDITQKCNEKLAEFGIAVIDVRMRKTDLPPDNAQNVYERMKSERSRIAKQYRSEGKEEATKIRASANRESTQILSEAYKVAEETKGEGDAQATKIYNNAYSKNMRFFKLWKTTEAYPDAFENGTRIIMDLDNEFTKYLKGK